MQNLLLSEGTLKSVEAKMYIGLLNLPCSGCKMGLFDSKVIKFEKKFSQKSLVSKLATISRPSFEPSLL